MVTLKHEDGSIQKMSLNEIGARLWPFGKWCIVWNHIMNGKHNGKKVTNKVSAVNSYIMHQSIGNSAMTVVGVKKIGGVFDGIEYRPTTRTEK